MQHDSHPRRFVVSPTGDLVLPADLLADLGLSANDPVEVTPTKTGFSVTRQVSDPSPAFEEALASALIDFHVTLEILRKGDQ